MRFIDLLRFAFMNLWRRKLRTILTVLGMVIGITSIVAMVSLGLGIEKATIDSFAGTGSLTIIQVNSYKWVEDDKGGSSMQTKLDEAAMNAFRNIDGVLGAMPMITSWGALQSGQYMSEISILGVDAETAELFGITLAEGSYPEHKGGGSYELVFGNYVLESFYNPKNWKQAIDRDGNPLITMDSRFRFTFDTSQFYGYDNGSDKVGKVYKISPVGIMSDESNDFSYYCLMDLTSLEKLMKANKDYVGDYPKSYERVIVKCDDIENVMTIKQQIDDMGYGTYSAIDAINMAKESTQRIRLLLGAIGGVSLLVAAIGIMNTMMMSIYERTKEIGIIKVLGLRMSNIVALFLSEAAYIGLFGGLMGLGFSYLLSGVVNHFVADYGLMSIIPPYLALGAVAFSILVALISGMYPAFRAMRLSPLTAIRSE